MHLLSSPSVIHSPAKPYHSHSSPFLNLISLQISPKTRFSLLPSKTSLKPLRCSASAGAASPPSVPSTDPEPGIVEKPETFDWYSKWYPLSLVCDLDKRAPHAKRVLGLDVVVWWDRKEERWQVFEDSCPHRLAPLSEGRIDGEGRLQCVYHGWCFDGSGACRYIPQAPPDGPPIHTNKKACVAAYPSYIQNKIVWFWPNTDPEFRNIAESERPPFVSELDDPSYAWTMGIRDLHYGYDVLVENFMDPAHGPYAHHKIMRLPKSPGPPPPDREGGQPLEIDIETLDIDGFVSRQPFGMGKFIAPCLFYTYPSPASNNGSISPVKAEENAPAKAQQKQRRVLLIFYCIPVSPGESRVIWVFPINLAVWMDNLIPRWIFHMQNNLILDSDLCLLHLEEKKIAEVGPSNWQKACFVPTKSDAQVIAFRKWFKKYANDRVDWGSKFDGQLPLTPPKEQLMDRYWTHVVHCRSCNTALKYLKVVEIVLQVISLASIGILAAAKEKIVSTLARSAVVLTAISFFLASKWLGHFIYKNFYYHDYNHASV